MAMLAESKRKQKWCLNPRGSLWANDDSKIGQKMLEKMGWSKGKGLGRDEQGDKSHILVSTKYDSKGLGYKGKDDEWIKHYEGFENVLAALNSENNSAATSPHTSMPNSNVNSEDEDSKVVSLEARSKSSSARVHYHKFTRGKDLSRYNADDIGCITGSKRAKQLAEAAKKDDFKEDAIGNQEHSSGVTTIKGGNIQDYFAKKMASLKERNNQQQEDSLGVSNNAENVAQEAKYFELNSENCENPKVKKKIKNMKRTEYGEKEEYVQSCEEKSDKKKKRKTKFEDSQLIFEKNEHSVEKVTLDTESSEDSNQSCDKKCDKKKKKTKKRKVKFEDSQLILEKNEHSVETITLATESSEDSNQTYNIIEAKKKKKKLVEQKNKDHFKINYESNSAEEPRKKKKKKKKKMAIVDAQENSDKETHYELEHQKKKKQKVACDIQEKDYEMHNEQEPHKKKKKKTKSTKDR